MSKKRRLMLTSAALAAAGIGTAAFIFSQHASKAEAASAAAASARPAPASRPAPALPASKALAAAMAAATAPGAPGAPGSGDQAKQAAVTRAEAMLQAQKLGRLAAAGRGADQKALNAESYAPRDVVMEADGSEHVRLQRSYLGLPVVGGDIVVHSRNGQFLSATQTLGLQVPDSNTLASPPQPRISPRHAVDAASTRFDGTLLDQPSLDTVYFAKDNQAKLAYQVRMTGLADSGLPIDDQIYVDANDGSYLGRKSNVLSIAAQGTAFTLNRGKVGIDTSKVTAAENAQGAGYVLKDEVRGNGQTLDFEGKDIADWQLIAAMIVGKVEGKPFFDTDNAWGDNQVNLAQRIGAEVHYGVAKTWDYYEAMHDRKGIFGDGKGVTAIADINAHIILTGEIEKTNAFWYTPLKTMFYLNGEAGVSNPVIALDVAGHEMSHGVAAATAGFLGSGDAAGLNEANSDINGTLVEFFDDNPKDPPDYLLGETVLQNGKPLRYMFKPSLDQRSVMIDGQQTTVGSYDCYPDGGFDYAATGPADISKLDAHFTSGVGNHFFYLLSEGAKVPASHRKLLNKSDLVCNGNTALTPITNKTAGQIWYRALRLYMTGQTDYPQAREATEQAAADLLARGLLSKRQATAVACAWDAVKVPLPPNSKAAQCQ